ncbi:transposase [Kovacikia minuta CCNUW1]|uniref:transposase n=1 Tax=Kovacikia minuta TaxID=2931930 RepID=UPI001CCC5335|nr:transposase [Kovacikia minuta CCNUW1]
MHKLREARPIAYLEEPMTPMMQLNSPTVDLAGANDSHPNYFQVQRRIGSLINRYLALEHLDDRLQDLPLQFEHPQPRPWKPINWHEINRQQIVGMEPEVFLAILVGAIDTEAPIRQYTQTSRKYLENLHPQLARFVGGIVADGALIEPGLWEKEERQHTPALIKVYTQLTGEKVVPTSREVRTYHPSHHPAADLYRHGLHRVATEYGATCLYLWLMAHSTGPLQMVLEELAQDEINHMTKFWGFGIWAFPETSFTRICYTLLQTAKGRLTYSRDRSSLIGTLHRMTNVLNWQSWSWTNRATFLYTCTLTLHRLWKWSNRLKQEELVSVTNFSPLDREKRFSDSRGTPSRGELPMTIAQREQQIHRVKAVSFQPELDEALEQALREAVISAVKITLESALKEELKAELAKMGDDRPRRSGYFQRRLDTQYGQVKDLRVPKLRERNPEREWQILQRYQRGLGNLLNWLCCLYVMGLSLRDLQEALYFLIGHVLSRSAVNQVTLQIQQHLDTRRLAPIGKTPAILIVDGVWVEIQYTREAFKLDRAGHLRQSRQAEERVILAVLAVWEDGSYEILAL